VLVGPALMRPGLRAVQRDVVLSGDSWRVGGARLGAERQPVLIAGKRIREQVSGHCLFQQRDGEVVQVLVTGSGSPLLKYVMERLRIPDRRLVPETFMRLCHARHESGI